MRRSQRLPYTRAAMAQDGVSRRRRPTSTRCARTPRDRRAASTCPATRAAPAADPALMRGVRRAGAGARHPGAHRGHRRRARADAVPAGPAARRRGVGRGAHLVPDQRRLAGQPRGLPGARPGAATRVVVQRNVHSSTIDGLIVSGLRPSFVAPGARPRARHRPLPHAGGARSRARRDARTRPARWSCRRPTSARSPTCEGLARGRARPRRAAGRRRGLGRAPRVSATSLPEHALAARRRPRRVEHAQDRRQLHPVGDAAPRARGGRLDEHVVDRAVTLVESTSPSSLLFGSLDAARGIRRRRSGARAARRRRSARSRRARQAIRAHPGPRRARRAPRRAAGRARATTRCGSSSTCAAPGVSGYQVAQLMRERRHPPRAGRRERDRGGVRHGGDGERQRRPPRRGARAGGRRSFPASDDAGRAGAHAAAPVGAARDDAARGVPRRAGGGADRGRGRADRGRVAGRLPAGHPERAARRAADRRDVGVHPGDPRARREPARRERPHAAHGARRGPTASSSPGSPTPPRGAVRTASASSRRRSTRSAPRTVPRGRRGAGGARARRDRRGPRRPRRTWPSSDATAAPGRCAGTGTS